MPPKRIGVPGIGRRLRQARLNAGLTQIQAAETIGVSWMTVHRLEKEQRIVRLPDLERLATVYGRTVRWFMTMDEGDILGSEEPELVTESARRIYERVFNAPPNHQLAVEKAIDAVLEGLMQVEVYGSSIKPQSAHSMSQPSPTTGYGSVFVEPQASHLPA